MLAVFVLTVDSATCTLHLQRPTEHILETNIAMAERSWISVRISYYLKRYQWVFVAVALLTVGFNVFTHLFPSAPPINFGDSYEGTLKGKYLSTIKDVNYLKSEEFYKKWSLIGHLDDLVNEPIEELSFHNSEDPFDVIKNFEKEQNLKYTELQPLQKAQAYKTVVLPRSKFQFKAIQETIYKDAFLTKRFINTRMKKWLRLKPYLSDNEQKILGIDDDWFRDAVAKMKQKKMDHNMVSSKEIENTFSHLKFFSNIFLKPGTDDIFTNAETSEEANQICSDVSKKLFNFFSGEYPVITTYDSQYKEKKIPYLSDENLKNSCFIKSLQMNSDGKGIVITAYDEIIPELTGLLALLRITGNLYPIQIIHKEDLSVESMKILTDIAFEPELTLPPEIKEFKVPKNLKTLRLSFMDVSDVLQERFKKYYTGFGMKLLAYLFNTFEEIIMMDTDTVIVSDIKKFFSYPEYDATHAYFFKDREFHSYLYDGIMDSFKSFLNYDREVQYLGLPRVSDETLNNRFFGASAQHYIESGLLAINKREKFDGVVTTFIIQMLRIFKNSLHGEKEFIWLGQEFMGNSYSLNANPAIAIGELSPKEDSPGSELCTTHPAHVNSDLELLWFNSGFLNCKKFESYSNDIDEERHKDKTIEELKKEYLSPIHITHGLVPLSAEFTATGTNGKPIRGWTLTSYCYGYMWCGYDVIGGIDNDLIPKGTVISFKEEETKKWDYLGELWVTYFDKGYKAKNGVSITGDSDDELGSDEMDDEDTNEFEEEEVEDRA